MKTTIITANLALAFLLVGAAPLVSADTTTKSSPAPARKAVPADSTPPELRGEEYRAPIKMKTYERIPVKVMNSRYR